jgi:hypothetical protein
MSLHAQEKGSRAGCLASNKPAVYIAQSPKEIDCKPDYLLALAYQPRLDRIQTRLSVLGILVVKVPQFLPMFGKQSVEEDDGVEVSPNTLHDYLGQVLILVCEEPQYLLYTHLQRRLEEEHQKL